MPIKSMSEKILQRIRDRRRRRLGAAIRIALVVILLVGVGADYYHQAHKDKIATASSWQGFSMVGVSAKGSWYESVGKINEDSVPAFLYIANQRWEIVKVNHFIDAVEPDGEPRKGGVFAGIQGMTYCDKRVIAYIRTEDARVLRSNLMHEVFHAGRCLHKEGDAWWNSAPSPKDSKDHLGVYNLGEFMATFAHDNPEFMMWESN